MFCAAAEAESIFDCTDPIFVFAGSHSLVYLFLPGLDLRVRVCHGLVHIAFNTRKVGIQFFNRVVIRGFCKLLLTLGYLRIKTVDFRFRVSLHGIYPGLYVSDLLFHVRFCPVHVGLVLVHRILNFCPGVVRLFLAVIYRSVSRNLGGVYFGLQRVCLAPNACFRLVYFGLVARDFSLHRSFCFVYLGLITVNSIIYRLLRAGYLLLVIAYYLLSFLLVLIDLGLVLLNGLLNLVVYNVEFCLVFVYKVIKPRQILVDLRLRLACYLRLQIFFTPASYPFMVS